MKTLFIWPSGAIIVLAAGFGFYQVFIKDDSTGQSTVQNVETGESSEAGATKTACDIFTGDVAQQVLGDSAKKGELPPAAEASTNDVVVSNCIYEIDDPNSLGILTANVLVRGGKTDTGKSSNKFGFENNKKLDKSGGQTGSSEDIGGLGEAAYYSPDFEQVNVLVGNGTYWLIVQAEDRQQAEKLARLIVENL